MSEFEYFFTGISIVLALAVARLLEGLRDTFEPARRFWIHSLWVVDRMLVLLAVFWSLFDNRAQTNLTFAMFLGLASSPAILFLQANALVTSRPDAVASWRDHFFGVRRWFFASNMLLAVTAHLVWLSIEPDEALQAPSLVYSLAGLLLSTVGYTNANERVHGILVVVSVVANVGSLTRIAIDPS